MGRWVSHCVQHIECSSHECMKCSCCACSWIAQLGKGRYLQPLQHLRIPLSPPRCPSSLPCWGPGLLMQQKPMHRKHRLWQIKSQLVRHVKCTCTAANGKHSAGTSSKLTVDKTKTLLCCKLWACQSPTAKMKASWRDWSTGLRCLCEWQGGINTWCSEFVLCLARSYIAQDYFQEVSQELW